MLLYVNICEVYHNMKRLITILLLITSTATFSFSEKFSRKEQIDQLYSIEYNIDTSDDFIEIKIISTNSAPYDEAYGNECIRQYLEEAMAEYGYYDSSEITSSKDSKYKDDFTMVRKTFDLLK